MRFVVVGLAVLAGVSLAVAARVLQHRAHPSETPARGTEMVSLPGGTFVLGETRETATVSPFSIDATEVTEEAYRACVHAGACSDAHVHEWNLGGKASSDSQCNYDVPGRLNHPMNCVDWSQADAYCRAQKKRLPTEAEWEWAARGGSEARIYPWGNEAPGDRICWSETLARTGTCPVGSHASGDAPGGIHDLAGNVAEWTATYFDASNTARVTRGGAFSYTDPAGVRAATRHRHDPGERVERLGFRCVR